MSHHLPATIEHLPVDALIPYARNSRTHSAAQVDQVAASIREFGFTNPVLIDGAGGIIAGHGRIMAARQIGLETVPCIRLAHLTDAQKRAYVIADNKLALNAGWDEELLAAELRDLAALDFDLDLTGFSDEETEAILAEEVRKITAEDVRAIEQQAEKKDGAPATQEIFEKEMTDKTVPGLLPIVPIYAEHHEAFIILCDNAIDEAWMRNKLGLEDKRKSYKDVKAQRANVITVRQLRERM